MKDLQLYTLERKADSNDPGHRFKKLGFVYDEDGESKPVDIKFFRWPNEDGYDAVILDPFDQDRFNRVMDDLTAQFDLIKINKVYNYNGEQL